MGNQASLEIQVDWDASPGVVTAGQTIRGTVVLLVSRPLRNGGGGDGKLRLLLHGKEKTAIQTAGQVIHSERNLISIHQTLREFRPLYRKIPKGDYRLPFSLTLPPQTPPSQQYPEGHNGRRRNGFRIKYQLQASLAKLTTCLDLHVQAAPFPSDQAVPLLVHPRSFPISTLNVIQQGEVILGVRLAETAVGRGEHIKLRLACRNGSTIEIRRVALKLVEQIEWKVESQGLTRQTTRTLVQRRDVDLPSLARDKQDRSAVRRLSRNDGSEREFTYQAIYDDLSSATEDVVLFVPEDSRVSYDGQLVKVRHELSIKLQTRSLSSNASISIPIRVGTRRSRGAVTGAHPASPRQQDNPPLATDALPLGIPVAQAVPMDVADGRHGVTIDGENEDDDGVQSVIVLSGDSVLPVHTSSLADLEPLPPPFPAEVSLANLLPRIDASLDCHALISSLLLEAGWVRFFCGMNLSDYSSIISRITPEDDQPRVALLLSEYVNGGDALTCVWVAAAARATSHDFRATTVQRLLPHCMDLQTNQGLIREELDAWELTVTEEDFQTAFRG